MMNASRAGSLGWKSINPRGIQRREPLMGGINSTRTSSARQITNKAGPAFLRRRQGTVVIRNMTGQARAVQTSWRSNRRDSPYSWSARCSPQSPDIVMATQHDGISRGTFRNQSSTPSSTSAEPQSAKQVAIQASLTDRTTTRFPTTRTT